ncbi:MAG: hypothetical protein AAFP77_20990 [Bacteroidota bacterium]
MRILTLLAAIFLINTLSLFGQERLEVQWQTIDGKLDTGHLNIYQIRSAKDFRIIKFLGRGKDLEKEIFHPGEQLQWAVHGQDTIITTHFHWGKTYYCKQLYTGEVKLYQALSKQNIRLFFLVRNNIWYRIQNANPREAAYKALRQNCQKLRPPKRLRDPVDAIELCRQINECLGVDDHRAYIRLWAARHELGINMDFLANSSQNGAPFNSYINGTQWAKYGITSNLSTRQRALSFSYNRRLFRYYPNLVAQLNGSFISFRTEGESTVRNFPSLFIPAIEKLGFSVFYLNPGILFRTGYRRQFQLEIGGGACFAIPLYTYRRIEQSDPDQTVPSAPTVQESRNLLSTRPGYYLTGGFNINLGRGIAMGSRVRSYRFEQQSPYVLGTPLLYSNLFPRGALAPYEWLEWQIQLRYSW